MYKTVEKFNRVMIAYTSNMYLTQSVNMYTKNKLFKKQIFKVHREGRDSYFFGSKLSIKWNKPK